jgi:hypothetical protein
MSGIRFNRGDSTVAAVGSGQAVGVQNPSGDLHKDSGGLKASSSLPSDELSSPSFLVMSKGARGSQINVRGPDIDDRSGLEILSDTRRTHGGAELSLLSRNGTWPDNLAETKACRGEKQYEKGV